MQWLGKLWHEFFHIVNLHCTDKYKDPFNEYIEEISTKQQESEKNLQETEQIPATIEDTDQQEDEPIAMRT